jgi:erythromycin esterase-like protein
VPVYIRRPNDYFIRKQILLLFLAATLPRFVLASFLFFAEFNDKQWIRWTRENAIHLDTLDSQEFDMGCLSFLDPLLEGKRIVFLGEPDHYIHEKYDYRLIFIKYLYQKGWRHIGMEMGRSDGRRVDRFLESGDKTHLNRLGLYGYRGDIRHDRDDFVNLSPGLKQQRFWDSFLGEEYWFLQQLYLLGSTSESGLSRISWFGYDVDTWPGGGYADARELTAEAREHPVVRNLWAKLARVEGETRGEEVIRLEEALKFLKDEQSAVMESIGQTKGNELERTIHCLLDSLAFLTAAWEGRNADTWIPANANREKTMFRQVDDIIAGLPSDQQIILLGHNMHLSKDHTTVGYPSFYPMWETLGSYLTAKYPDEVLSIWMLYDRGHHATLSREDKVFEDVQSHPWRIERHLAQAGALFLLPIKGEGPGNEYLSKTSYFCVNGRLGKGILQNQIDVLFFINKVKAIRKR